MRSIAYAKYVAYDNEFVSQQTLKEAVMLIRYHLIELASAGGDLPILIAPMEYVTTFQATL